MMKKFIKAVLAGMMFLCCLACVNRVSARDKDGDLVVIIDPGHGGTAVQFRMVLRKKNLTGILQRHSKQN